MPTTAGHEIDDLLHKIAVVRKIVFDLSSLESQTSGEEEDNFRQIVNILTERDYTVLLWSAELIDIHSTWPKNPLVKHIKAAADNWELLFQNKELTARNCLWVTHQSDLQQELIRRERLVAGQNMITDTPNSVHLQFFSDLLALCDPSVQTAMSLAQDIAQLKYKAPKIPLVVGIGGPDECGHPYFCEALVTELEKYEFVVEGMDLTQVLGTEYRIKNESEDYWKTPEIRDWLVKNTLKPFSEGQRVFLEEAPNWVEVFEVFEPPLFLAPEMVLVVWGTTLFIPELEPYLDWKIVLELTPRVAAARLFGIDDRENFAPSFVDKYMKTEGQLYNRYLDENNVMDKVGSVVNFNNFHAFRMQSE